MKRAAFIFLTLSAVLIAACHSSKKGSASPPAGSKNIAANTATPSTPLMKKHPTGIYVPGNAELVAIQVQYQDVTPDKLNQGHILYSTGACIACHSAKSIYSYETEQWKDIIDDMARKAKITTEQKDAVYKYVLAIKATEPK